MKTLSKILSVAAATALAGAAYAGDLEAVQIQNAHGQTLTMYRPAERTTVALFVAGRGVGRSTTNAGSVETKAAIKQNVHGQTAVQFERSGSH